MSQFDPEIIEAVAESWASIDGKAQLFRDGKGADLESIAGGHYEGYTAEAAELMARLMKRGYIVIPFKAAVTDAALLE